MAIINKDFRVKNGLYVGENIDLLRGTLSALEVQVGNGYGSTGLTISNIGDLSANGIGVFDGNVYVGGGFGDTGVTLTSTGNISADGEIYAGGGFTFPAFVLSLSGDVGGYLSIDNLTGEKNITTTIQPNSVALGTDTTGDYVESFALNTTVETLTGTIGTGEGAVITGLGLKATGVTAGSYGTQTEMITATVDETGRLTGIGTTSITTTLSTEAGTGTGTVDLLTQSLRILGTSNEITTVASGQTVTISLPDDVTIGNNLTVTGNLVVNGDTVTQDVSSVLIEDPVIKLANGNTASDIKDIGFYGEYSDSGTKYTGLIRDVTFAGGNKPYVFFAGTTTDILSANVTGAGKPGVSEFADVYMGRIGIHTSNYDANNRLTVSGAISGDSTLTIDGNTTIGGGYGDTGITLTDAGNLSMNGDLVVDGTSTLTGNVSGSADLYVAGSVYIGGGYGDTGVTITADGVLSADGGIFADAFYSKTGGSAIDFNDNVDIDGTLTTTGTVTFSGLNTGTSNTVLVRSGSNEIVTDDIDPKVWDIKLVDYGTATTNRLTKFTDTTGTIDNTIISDDGTTVTVGVGSSNDIRFIPGSDNTSVKFGGETTGYHSTSATVAAATNNGVVLSMAKATVRSAKVVIQSTIGTQYEVAELLMIHDGTDAYLTEYGNISTGATFKVTYDAIIDGDYFKIRASNSDGSNAATIVTGTLQTLLV